MINVVNINKNDIENKLPRIFSFLQDEYQSVGGEYYKYELDGLEYFFNRNGNRVVVMWDKDGEFLYSSFYMDNNYGIKMLETDNYFIDVTDDILVYYEKATALVHFIRLLENPDSQYYNTLLAYTQWDKESDERVTLFYEYMYDENKVNMIYPHQIETPHSIEIDKKGTFVDEVGHLPFAAQKYLLIKSLPGDRYYDYFKNKEEKEKDGHLIKRFLRWYGTTADSMTLFPFGKYWKVEDMFKKLNNKGFKTTIPEDIVEINNEGIVDMDEFIEIVETIKNIDLGNEEQIEEKYVLDLRK